MYEIFLDTETTGLDALNGDRVVGLVVHRAIFLDGALQHRLVWCPVLANGAGRQKIKKKVSVLFFGSAAGSCDPAI